MQKTWIDFYKERVNNLEYEKYFRERYKPFLNVLKAFRNPSKLTVEAGCGIGTPSKELFEDIPYPNAILYDICPKMVEMTKKNLSGKNPSFSESQVLQDDCITSLIKPKSGLIFAHGVLEHFSDNDIRRIIGLQKLLAETVVHYVPTDKYHSPSFGDERLMNEGKWKGIANHDHAIPFNDGHDLILIWKGKCS